MKYWNKTKKYRETQWTLVIVDYQKSSKSWMQMKVECQRDGSKNRFYTGNYTKNNWYFENEEDALVFKLKYGYKIHV